ncbi:hypothetical protein BGY98DRAFT_991315 [Russula aff. rugulosa BPL654]|nr:hypothetical protein BGY98DRAFT_991315 [Russula aff. rugulosa BPL654]
MHHYSLSHKSRYRVQAFLFHVHLVWLKRVLSSKTSGIHIVVRVRDLGGEVSLFSIHRNDGYAFKNAQKRGFVDVDFSARITDSRPSN